MTFRRHHHQQPTEAPVVKKEAEKPTEFEKAIASVAEEEKETEIVQEEKPPVTVEPPVKKRTDTKEVLNVGIVGDTIEVKDFRAIVKKAGKQINVVLTEIISEWNQKNYNL